MAEPAPRSASNARLLTALVLAVGCGLTWWSTSAVHQQKLEAIERQFSADVSDRLSGLRRSIADNLEACDVVASVVPDDGRMDSATFGRIVGPLAARHRSLQALEWIPRLPAEDRAAHEAAARAEGLADYTVWAKGPSGHSQPSTGHDEFFPVRWVRPVESNEAAIGFDLASEPTRLAALQKARATRELVLSRRIRLVQETASQAGVLLFRPVFRAPREDAPDGFAGFALGVLRVGDLARHSTRAGSPSAELALVLLDTGAAEPEQLLFDGRDPASAKGGSTLLQRSELIDVGDAQWEARIVAPAGYIDARLGAAHRWVLGMGLLTTVLLTLLVDSLLRRNLRVESLVASRTAQLREESARRETQFAELELAREVADAGIRAQRAFLAGMAHELRTPLNAIIGFSEQVKDGQVGAVTDGQKSYLDEIFDSGVHLLDLINEVLDLSKIESEQFDLRSEAVDLPALMSAVAKTIGPLVTKGGNSFVLDLPPMAPVEGDPTRLRQILLNLLGNAARFTTAGEVALRLKQRAPGGPVEFEVADTGMGIAANDHERIFERFYQVDPVDGVPDGTGLGLAITQQLCRVMGGDVRVSSQLGRGTVFTVTLPLPVLDEDVAAPG